MSRVSTATSLLVHKSGFIPVIAGGTRPTLRGAAASNRRVITVGAVPLLVTAGSSMGFGFLLVF